MQREAPTCPACHEGTLEPKSGTRTIKARIGNGIQDVVVRDIEWEECPHCGEIVFGCEAVEKIEQTIRRVLNPETTQT